MNREATISVEEVIEQLVPQRRFQPYPDYRDSGVEWLKEAPTHWTVRKLKYVASLRSSNVDKKSHDDEPPVRLCNYTDVYYNEHINSAIAFMDATASTDEIERFSLKRGDVLITKDSEDPNDIAVPACVVDDLEGVLCGYHLAQVRPHPRIAHGPYLARAFSASGIRDQFNSQATGITRHGLSKDTIGSSLFFIPPPNEQRAIVAFLDRETARIDELIAKKQRLIELLAEKRSALISHAVTKGLNPDTPMKDSGIEWLGQVPDHWDVVPLRYICSSIQTGPFGSQLHQSDYQPGGIPLVNPVHLVNGHIVPGKNSAVDEDTCTRLARHILQDGDILFARRGEIGRCGLVSDHETGWLCGTGCMRVRLIDSHSPYFNLLFNSYGFADNLTLNAVGTTMLNINNTILACMVVPRPPLEEQRTIAAALNRRMTKFDELIAKVGNAIGKLREYRSALISAAVTGKIDLRREA